HIVLDAFTVHDLSAKNILSKFQVGAEIQTPAGGASGKVELVVIDVFPFHAPDNARQLHVSGRDGHPVFGRQVRQLEEGHDVVKFNPVGVYSLVSTGPG